jgi:hypothetical protein
LIIDTVIEETKQLYFGEFIDYVYATRPVSKSPRGSHLDLVAFAREEAAVEKLPTAMESEELTAQQFAETLEKVEQEAARLFFDERWQEQVNQKGVIHTEAYLLPDLDIDRFSMNKDLTLFTDTQGHWKGTLSAKVECTALVDRGDAASHDSYEQVGYGIADGNWDDYYVLLGRDFDAVFEFTLERSPTNVAVNLVRVTLN